MTPIDDAGGHSGCSIVSLPPTTNTGSAEPGVGYYGRIWVIGIRCYRHDTLLQAAGFIYVHKALCMLFGRCDAVS